jgi:hypothetical protein
MLKTFKYKLDFYYQSLVIYFLFFILYAVIKGKFFEEKFQLIFNDPILYILIIFIVVFLAIVMVNIIRNKQIILESDRIIFKNRFGSREISHSDIIKVRILKKRIPNDDLQFRIIKMKLKNRKRLLRIRTNDYERGSELIKELVKINQTKSNI